MEYEHLEHCRFILFKRLSALSPKQTIKVMEYAGALLDAEHVHLFHQRELFELSKPYKRQSLQTQPRKGEGQHESRLGRTSPKRPTDEELVALMQEHNSSYKVAQQLGVDPSTVSLWVRQLDEELKPALPPRNLGGRPKDKVKGATSGLSVTDEELINLMWEHGSCYKVAAHLGCARGTVDYWLRHLNPELKALLPPRNKGGAHLHSTGCAKRSAAGAAPLGVTHEA